MTPDELVRAVAQAPSWNARVTLIRRIPEAFGTSQHQTVYARVAEEVYVQDLKPDFGYVHWRPEYELQAVLDAYADAEAATSAFRDVGADDIARAILARPRSLRAFRLMLGLTSQEFAASTTLLPPGYPATRTSKGRIDAIESGRHATATEASTLAAVIDLGMRRSLFPSGDDVALRSKQAKPDTARGWDSIRVFARDGVPLGVFLHQRAYGGAFRQLLDATSTLRGDRLEEPVAAMFGHAGIPFIRTGSRDQGEIERRFGLTVRPAPDFVVFDNRTDTLRAMVEMKGANDGGTARDKAARFRSLRAEAQRLGGVPLFAVLGGLGWRRTHDALGPVIRDTDGRVFTAATIDALLQVEPFPALTGLVDLLTWPEASEG